MKYNRICPRCKEPHNTHTKSSKAICDKCKLIKKKQSKKYKAKQVKKELKLKDKAWSIEIRRDCCLICCTTEHLNAHHLIPREIKETRHELRNGVSLCARHHKYSYEVSAHKNSAMFLLILKQKNPEQYSWLVRRLGYLKKKWRI